MADVRSQGVGADHGLRVAAVVARHEGTLLRVARAASLCHDDALDAYQRALEIFVRRVATVDPATELGWLKVVVRHEAMAIRRSRSESVSGEDVDVDVLVAAADRPVEEVFAAGERVRQSAEALRALKPDEAKALMMKAHGLSYEEIGRQNGWSYTNVMSTLAVFIALGGSSYAALHLRSRDIANNTLRSIDVRNHTLRDRDVRRNALTGRSIKEFKLGRVPRAKDAYRVGGLTAEDLLVKCPPGTFPTSDVCVEITPRTAAPYSTAILVCAEFGQPAGPGRRLPTHSELRAALAAVDLTPGGELTSDVYPSSSSAGALNVLYVTDEGGSVSITPDTYPGRKAYRCVADPLN